MPDTRLTFHHQLDDVQRDLLRQAAVQLALVGRYYERIGDHAVNISERVQYMVTGSLPDHGAATGHPR